MEYKCIFRALASPETYGTEHYVYVKLVRDGDEWAMTPLLTGRTIESARASPDRFDVRMQSDAQATQHWEHQVDAGQANTGVATYLWSYVCFAPPPPRQKWVYGVVVEYFYFNAQRADLFVHSEYGRYGVSVQDPSLHVVSLAGYALRPFNHLPADPAEMAAVKATTDMLVSRFLTGPRHAALNLTDVPLACVPLPRDGIQLMCILRDESRCIMSVDTILSFAHSQFRMYGRENARTLGQSIVAYRAGPPTQPMPFLGPPFVFPRKAPTREPRNTLYAANLQVTLTTTDVPDLRLVQEGTWLATPALASVFEGFPSAVYIRQEMKMVWDLCRVNFTLPDANDSAAFAAVRAGYGDGRGVDATDALPLLVAGSSGVGHSVLLVLWVAYLGVYHDFDALLLRAVPHDGSNNADEYVRQDAVVWVRGDTVTNCPGIARSEVAARMEAAASTARSQHKSLLFVADGYAPSEINTPGSSLGALTACHVIASSASGHDSTDRVSVMLPAWSRDDLVHVHNETIDDVDERYAMAGGCVRQFLEPPPMTWQDAPDSVASTERLYIHNTHDYVHYVLTAHRRAVVDVKRALRRLTTTLSTAYLTDLLQWSSTSSNESLYELLFDATIRKRAVEGALQLSTGDASRTLAVTGKVMAHGESTAACLHYLATELEDATYWLPHRAVSFGAVDAVVVQDRCVYYLKTTVATEPPSIDGASLQTVHAAVVGNPNVAGYDHVYVFVTPAGRRWHGCMGDRPSQLPGLCVWCASVL